MDLPRLYDTPRKQGPSPKPGANRSRAHTSRRRAGPIGDRIPVHKRDPMASASPTGEGAGASARVCRRPRHARTRRISGWLIGVILISGLCAQATLGAARHATVVVHEKFSARYGIAFEGFDVYLEVTGSRDKHVLINHAFAVDRHAARLAIPPGEYQLKRYVRDAGPIVCGPTPTCTQQLGPPSTACTYHLRLRRGQVLSLLVAATIRDCSITRTP
jgi:hypothetical protein